MRKEPTSAPGPKSLRSADEPRGDSVAIPVASSAEKRSGRFTSSPSIAQSLRRRGDGKRGDGAAEHVVEREPEWIQPHQIAGVIEEGGDGGGPAMEGEVGAIPVVEV